MPSIVALNLAFLCAGATLLWGLNAVNTRREAVQLIGLAHLVGAASVVLLTIQLVILGVELGPAVFISFGSVCATGIVMRRLRLRSFTGPRRSSYWVRLLTATIVIPLGVYFVFVFRLAPQLGVWEPDAVSAWTMRAKLIFFARGLDVTTLRSAGAFAYPLWESMLQALDFLSLGRADDVVFHVQFAIMLVSFIAAIAGVSRRAGVPLLAIWPVLGLFVVTPEVQARGLSPLADLVLDYFFATAALLLVVWLETRAPWLLVSAAILLAAAISTKREGLLLAIAAFAAAFICSARSGRKVILGLVVATLCTVGTFVPWRIWIALHGSSTDVGNLSTGSLRPATGQIAPAARLLSEQTIRYGAWLLVVPVALALALAAGFLAGTSARRVAAFFGLAMGFSFAGFLAIWWLVPDLQTTANAEQPAVRLAGALVALSASVVPILVARSLCAVSSDAPLNVAAR